MIWVLLPPPYCLKTSSGQATVRLCQTHCDGFVTVVCFIQGPSLPPAGACCLKIKQIQSLPLPGGERGSITCLLYARKCNQFFATCLDDTLKLFDEQFRLQATFRWHGGVHRSMVYNHVYDELITSGRNGVKTWICEPDYKAFAKNAAAPISARSSTKITPGTSAAAFVTKLKGGKAPPWELGAFQSIRERATFRCCRLRPCRSWTQVCKLAQSLVPATSSLCQSSTVTFRYKTPVYNSLAL